MENHILNFGFSYLFGLGFLGYVFLLYIIRKAGEKSGWPTWSIYLIVALHFISGLIAIIFFTPTYLRSQNLAGQFSIFDTIIFVLTSLFMFVLVFWIVYKRNSFLNKDYKD